MATPSQASVRKFCWRCRD